MTLSLCISPVTDWQPESGCTLLLWPVTVGTSASCNPELNKWLSGWWMEGFAFAFLPSMSKSPGTETGKLPLPGLLKSKESLLARISCMSCWPKLSILWGVFFFYYLGKLLKTVYTVTATLHHLPFWFSNQLTAVTVDHHTFLLLTHSCACISKKPSLFGALVAPCLFFFSNYKKPINLISIYISMLYSQNYYTI